MKINEAGSIHNTPTAVPAVEDMYPLTPLQKGMLYHSLSAPGSGVYLEQLSCIFEGELDISAFLAAWQQVVNANAILRTAFVWADLEEPLQVVLREIELPIEQYDWQALSPEMQTARWLEFLATDRKREFDMEQAPLMRITLIQRSKASYYFVWTHHHALLDGWCLSLVIKDLFTFYESLRRGQTVTPSFRRPYREYIAWLKNQDISAAEQYWRSRLQGLSTTTALSLSTSGSNRSQHTTFKEKLLTLPQQDTLALDTVIKHYHLTLNTIVQGAWALLLSRYTGETDILYGVTVSGRPAELKGVEEMVGLFINALPLRVQISSDEAVKDWLRDLQNQNQEMRQFEYAPLFDIHRWSQIPHGQPLFQSLLVFENYPLDQMVGDAVNSLAATEISFMEQTNYPLTIVVNPGKQLAIRVIYNATLFDAGAIGELLTRLEILLQGIISQTELPLARLSLIAATEYHQLVHEWNTTLAHYRRNTSIIKLIEEQAQCSPESVAVIFAEHRLNYSQLNAHANRIAHYLLGKGVSADSLVGICAHRSIELVVGLLGIMKAGAAYLPLDPDYPQERLSALIKDSGLHWILLQPECAEAMPSSTAQLIRLDQELAEFSLSPADNPVLNIAPEQLAYVLYTSGSTGFPKAVGVPHKGLLNRLFWMQERFRLSEADAVLQKTPYSFDVSVWEFFWPLMIGARLIVVGPNEHKDPERLITLIETHSVTTIHFVPSMLRVFLEAADANRCKSLKRVICSGEALSPELRQLFFSWHQAELHNLYGPTEASIDVTAWQCQKDDTDACVPIGRPIANTRTYILDRYFNPVPFGVPGELCLGGIQLARGYLSRPELTAERFIPDPFSDLEGERLYRTGDLARYRADGVIDYLGRIDRQVKLRGFRIELGEIEARLLQHPLIKEAVVIIREEPLTDKRLVAYVVAREESVGGEMLKAYLQAALPEYMVPAFFVFLQSLPLTVSGKLDRKALPAPDSIHLSTTGYVAPSNPMEQTLVELWSSVLGVKQIGIHDDFFALGGHSILATQLLFRIREAFNCNLPLQDLFQMPTITSQARLLVSQDHCTRAEVIDWEAESRLDEVISPIAPYCPASVLKSVFLTGATGFLGVFLLRDLLQQTQADVYCLVRSPTPDQGFKKIKQCLDKYGLWDSAYASRIHPVCGDLSESRLGMQWQQWQQLAEEVNAIYHNGALVNFVYPYSSLKPANVSGTQEVLRFASTLKIKPVHYISTVSIFEDDVNFGLGIGMEDDFPEDGSGLVGGYAQSKWVAEKMVRTAASRGLPVSIYRPSIITGDSCSGVWNTGDYFSNLIGACLLLDKAPAQESLFNTVPVDYVSRALVSLSRQPQAIGKTYHLTNPNLLSSRQLFDWAGAVGLILERVNFNDWLTELHDLVGNASDHPLFSLVPILDQANRVMAEDEVIDERPPAYDCQNVIAGLSGTGIVCPTPSEQLWSRYFQYLHKAYAEHPSLAI